MDTWSLTEAIKNDIDVYFTFTILSVVDVSKVSIEVRFYENPNRAIKDFLIEKYIFFIIPDIGIFLCGIGFLNSSKN
ncbi:MAG: hypothetical protein ACTSWX_14225 [Promethearchaeota archaeon]